MNEYTVKFRNTAPGLIFFKGLFRGLIFGGAYFRWENFRFKLGWAYNWREIWVGNFSMSNDNIGVLTRNS